MTFDSDVLGLYIHVPFCLRKCPYCDFYSCENRLHERELYVQAVCRNIKFYGKKQKADTLYFGGGTPSLLSPLQVSEIIACAENEFELTSPEITMEVNPATVTLQTLREYRSAGVNRLSIGVQDLHNDSLEILGRLHTAEQAVKTVYDAKTAGFENISCDLMIGTKGQTSEKLRDTLCKLTALPINHISAYMLKIEEGTPYAKSNMSEFIPDEDETADLYLEMVSFLENKGFLQYEISNFAKKGFESRHNCRYWKLSPYIGIGPAAHSCFNGKRSYVPSDLDMFMKEEHQKIIIEDDSPDISEERIMLGLRLTEGIPISWLDDEKRKKAEIFIKAGLMKIVSDKLSFTPKGFLVSNSILCELI